jgi:hypothetical protein
MVVFRTARPEEIQTIRALERASAQRFIGLMDALAADEPSPASVLAARIADGGLVVAVEDGPVVGFVMFRRVEARAYVEQLDVLPAFEHRHPGPCARDPWFSLTVQRPGAPARHTPHLRRTEGVPGTRPGMTVFYQKRLRGSILSRQFAHGALQVVLLAQRLDQAQLHLEEVDVLLGVAEDLAQQFAADIVADLFALDDAGDQGLAPADLDRQVAGQAFGHGLADLQLVQVLQVGQAFQEQDAVDQLVGVFHLADRLVVGDLAQALEAPVVVHPRVQEVLVHRRQLVGEHRVQEPDDAGIALHGGPPQIRITARDSRKWMPVSAVIARPHKKGCLRPKDSDSGDPDLSLGLLQPLCLQVFLSLTEKRETASRSCFRVFSRPIRRRRPGLRGCPGSSGASRRRTWRTGPGNPCDGTRPPGGWPQRRWRRALRARGCRYSCRRTRKHVPPNDCHSHVAEARGRLQLTRSATNPLSRSATAPPAGEHLSAIRSSPLRELAEGSEGAAPAAKSA